MVTITYFVHGTTTDNENKLSTGWLPGELSELGKQQATQLGKQVADQKFAIVFCSDLKRAVDSATLGFGDKYEIKQDDRLRECSYGDNNGQPEIFKEHMEDFIDNPFPNGESYRDVEARLESFCDFLKENYEGKHVAVVAHEGPQLALDVLLKNKSWEQAIRENWRDTGAWQPGWEYIIP
jgi:alpha-ribazole phosphatase/probable phosphoglycerate mutase